MIQRILRGRWLYLVLAAIVMVIYARGMPALAPIVLEEPEDHAALQEQAVELWPKELDAHGLTEATRRHPVLGMVLTLLTLLMGMLIAGGLAYSWWHVLTGKVRTIWGFASKKLPAWTFAELGRIMALMIIAFSLLPLLRFAPFIEVWGPPTTSPVWIPLTMLCLDLFLIIAIFAFASGKGGTASQMVGLSTKRVGPVLLDAFRGYLVIFPFLLLTLFLTVEIIRFFNLKPPIEPIQALLFQQRDPAVIILLVVLSCVIAPVAEELFFRGVVFAAIRHKTTRGWAIFLSGAAFSLVHTNVVGFLPIMLIGMFLSYIYERTGSLVAPIAVHIVHNTFLLALGLTVRRLLLD
jgi:membrane protease YdiL (CAAX protease family)